MSLDSGSSEYEDTHSFFIQSNKYWANAIVYEKSVINDIKEH